MTWDGRYGTPEHRIACIAEALDDLEKLFFEPGCFGDCTFGEQATSLESEFIGAYADEEIVRRIREMVAAESGGKLPVARRHLTWIRRKVQQRWGVDVKGQVAVSHRDTGGPQTRPVDPSTGEVEI